MSEPHSNELDLLAFPLHGRQLIEASAGTGKTYSITALYVRALLGHGLGDASIGLPPAPDVSTSNDAPRQPIDVPSRPIDTRARASAAAKGKSGARRGGLTAQQFALAFDAPADGVNLSGAPVLFGATEFGAPVLFGAPLPIEQLLVVTFTEAATEELRGRIRMRLLDVRKRLQTGERTADNFVEQLVAQIPNDLFARSLALIERGLGALDAAAVYTIHGFCQRALQEYAFESQVAFSEQFVLDGDDYLRAAVSDAWRRLMYGASELKFMQLQRAFATPSDLWKIVAPLLKREDLQATGVVAASVDAAVDTLEQAIVAFKDTARALNLVASLRTSRLSTNEKTGPARPARIAALADLLAAPHATGNGVDGGDVVSLIGLYGTAELDKALRKNTQATFDMARVGAAADQVVAAERDLRACALRQVLDEARPGAAQEKARLGVVSSDDLLTRTLAALSGPRGEVFAARLRERYPLAMMDEFQDTDTSQWQIFQRIYAPAYVPAYAPSYGPSQTLRHPPPGSLPGSPQQAPARAASCVLIGDPKQAIYGFRGADIYSYLDARAALGDDAIHRLTHTRRAGPRLASAFNALYAAAADDGFMLASIRYLSVASAVEGASFTLAGVEQPALTFWYLATAKAIGKGAMVSAMAALAAQRIDAMLRGDFHIDGAQLVPGDLAILVRNGKEAAAMLRALRVVGRDAAFLTRDSVFDSDAAQFVRWLLIALQDPNDDTRLRAVLTSPIGGWGPARLQRSVVDEGMWEREQARLQDLLACGLERGVLAMLRQLVSDFALSARWLAQTDGARWLTDLRHLGELLTAEAARLGGGSRLLRWLEQRMSAAVPDDAFRVRLETDEALIKIVTLHSAKGLEYPVVILPFMTAARAQKNGVHHIAVDNVVVEASAVDSIAVDSSARRSVPARRHVAVADLAGQSADAVDDERLAEDLRLLYVGMTRAKRACFLGVANCESNYVGVHRSGLGRLLIGAAADVGKAHVADLLTECMGRLAELCPAIAVEHLSAGARQARPGVDAQEGSEDSRGAAGLRAGELSSTAAARARNGDPAPPLQVRQLTGYIDASWRINSYSSLTRDTHAARGNGAEYTAPGVDDEDVVVDPLALDVSAAIQYQFTRGAAAGVVLHRLLERWPLGSGAGDPAVFVATELRSSGLGGDEAQALAVTGWLERVRAMPLAPLVASLASLDNTRVEMEFALPLHRLPTQRLSAVLAAFGYRGDPLSAQTVAGMLKGFIDLVFFFEGSYYIVDYKSNFLGGNAASYGPENIAQAMREHRYDLQFLLYAVALRRWLRLHGVVDATPRVFYLFLRGIDAPGSGIYHHVPAAGVLDALDELFR